MSNQSPGNRVQSELEQAVQTGLLSASDQENANMLLERLQKPVRLAIMGPPSSGKSRLLNLLVGFDVIPNGVHLPTLDIVYGDAEQAVCTLSDGSKEQLSSIDADIIAGLSPVFVEVQLPLPALRKISVLEVVAPDDTNAMHRSSQWAAKRTDIALWCTRGFTEPEQRVWSAMPDIIKDHAFCMVTHSDILQSKGLFQAAVGAITAAARDEFNAVLPIATNDAIAARGADGAVDKTAMRESGGSALISAVLKQVERGRQSAVDSAELLLYQNADLLASPKDPAPQPAEAPVAPPEEIAQEAAAPTAAIARLRAIAERKNAPPIAQAVEDTPPEVPTPPIASDTAPQALHPATRDAYAHVVTYLDGCGTELAMVLEDHGDAGPAEVMDIAADRIQWLCDYLNDNGDASDLSLQRARDTVFDAADMVQLMQMEKQGNAALEAISLMLQIKRELQADLAA